MNERALRAAMAVAKATRNPGLRSWLNTAFLAQCDELNEALSVVAREDEITQKVTVPDTTHSTARVRHRTFCEAACPKGCTLCRLP